LKVARQAIAIGESALQEEYSTVDKDRLLIPALAGIYNRFAPFSYAFIRIVIALMFLVGGIDKIFHGGAARIAAGNITNLGLKPPYAWAWAVTLLEFFGAILLGLGLFTRPVAFALTVELTVIAFGIMALRGFFWTTGGMEVALLMEVATIGFVFGGGGRYSLDAWRRREF
jgi:putative oxidoreductase